MSGEPPPETPSGIAAKLFEQAVQPAATIIVIYGAGRGRGPQSGLVIGATVVLWAVQVVAVAVAVLTQIAEAPRGRRFLPLRWLALAPVFHAFLASRWLMLLTVLLAYGHSWYSLGWVLALIVTGILASTYHAGLPAETGGDGGPRGA